MHHCFRESAMQTLRKAEQRGGADYGWLKTAYSFSFSDYMDPEWMGFRSLRVINDDHVAAGHGFPMHPHRDMEIFSYMVSGRLAHKDSMGHEAVVGAGEVQRISAGRGILHSEANPDRDSDTHLLQIWIKPHTLGLEPSYAQKYFAPEEKANRLALIVSGDGRDGSISINQDADVYASLLDAGASVSHSFAAGRYGWLQLVSGSLTTSAGDLSAGDGLALSELGELSISATRASEFLLFDLA
jgi:redox-sensitive bicupin YhaK (pirin superfamily)